MRRVSTKKGGKLDVGRKKKVEDVLIIEKKQSERGREENAENRCSQTYKKIYQSKMRRRQVF